MGVIDLILSKECKSLISKEVEKSPSAVACLKDIIEVARGSGERILKVYNSDWFDTQLKGDSSPITRADHLSHEYIMSSLKSLYPDVPILSEEMKTVFYEERKNWEYFWLVDPLDGTKEFINKRDEFTVNIAFIYGDKPVLGVIYEPVSGTVYYAEKGKGAKKISACGNQTELDGKVKEESVVVLNSFSHLNKETEAFIGEMDTYYKGLKKISVGSSLKFCVLAEGGAHIYPRFGRTMEWDTAAGQIILEEAGGRVVDLETKKLMKYNKEILTNNYFVAYNKYFNEDIQ